MDVRLLIMAVKQFVSYVMQGSTPSTFLKFLEYDLVHMARDL